MAQARGWPLAYARIPLQCPARSHQREFNGTQELIRVFGRASRLEGTPSDLHRWTPHTSFKTVWREFATIKHVTRVAERPRIETVRLNGVCRSLSPFTPVSENLPDLNDISRRRGNFDRPAAWHLKRNTFPAREGTQGARMSNQQIDDADSEVNQFAQRTRKPIADLAQRVRMCHLAEQHRHQLCPAREPFGPSFSVVFPHQCRELRTREML